jgi:polyhydroxyalkanoate synthesis regulator phasin
MDAPGSGPGSERDPLERLISLLGPRFDEARSLFDDATGRWRGDALRLGEGTRRKLQELAREIGLVTRDDWDELELRVAQLEHRLRLIENRGTEQP